MLIFSFKRFKKKKQLKVPIKVWQRVICVCAVFFFTLLFISSLIRFQIKVCIYQADKNGNTYTHLNGNNINFNSDYTIADD